MRQQIAAANWKMNLNYQDAQQLLEEILGANISLQASQQVLFAVPFPYLTMARSEVEDKEGFSIAAQDCSSKKSGAFTGEVSAEMLSSVFIRYCLVGHSERREYHNESNQLLAEKIDQCLANNITPVFCCGEALAVREAGSQNAFVKTQLEASLFHLSAEVIQNIVIAYEPIWAIGTGKTASTDQAQEMHKHIRTVLAEKYGKEIADKISILYGGSVKPANAKEIFGAPDVDGGLVGGASLIGKDFIEIIKALKQDD